MFLRSLQAVASEGPRLDDERRRALDLALRYFRESAPKHTADEEESLFPRLRSVGDPELKTALEKVEALERDHREADALHRQVDELGKLWLERGRTLGGGFREIQRCGDEARGNLSAAYSGGRSGSVSGCGASFVSRAEGRDSGRDGRAKKREVNESLKVSRPCLRHLYSCVAPTGLVDFSLYDPDLTVWAYECRRSAATLVAEGKKTARFLDSWPRDPTAGSRKATAASRSK